MLSIPSINKAKMTVRNNDGHACMGRRSLRHRKSSDQKTQLRHAFRSVSFRRMKWSAAIWSVSGTCSALRFAAEHRGVEAVNLGTGTGTSVLELVEAFERVNEVPVPYEIAPRRAGDLAVSWADVTKAAALLGWRAEKIINDMCRDSRRWERNSRAL